MILWIILSSTYSFKLCLLLLLLSYLWDLLFWKMSLRYFTLEFHFVFWIGFKDPFMISLNHSIPLHPSEFYLQPVTEPMNSQVTHSWNTLQHTDTIRNNHIYINSQLHIRDFVSRTCLFFNFAASPPWALLIGLHLSQKFLLNWSWFDS